MLLLSGTLHAVLTSIFLILDKVAKDAADSKARGGRGADEHADGNAQVRSLHRSFHATTVAS